MPRFADYMRLVKFQHTIFAMPFALMAFAYAMWKYALAEVYPVPLWWCVPLVQVVLCMVFARNTAMGFNRWADRRIDAANPRTAGREIPAGVISPRRALTFVAVNALLFVACAATINRLTALLSPVALAVIMGYSYCKRFTWAAHLVLGLSLSIAPVGAYIALTGRFDWEPCVLALLVLDAMAAEAGRTVEVALRVNPDIDPKTNHCIDTGQADSKFGISYEEILDNAERIRSLKHLRIVGVHLHIGSQIRELHVFENMCQKVNVIVENLERLGFSFRFVDVGGGLGINYDMPENEPIPNFASLFAIVHNHLRVGDREVHFEFGRSIVGECGELITRVLFNKTTATGRKLLIVDASMTELIRPALYGSYHNIENITAETDRTDKYTVVGTACESTDRFDENVSLRRSVRGDLLTIKSAGAYGMSMASRYNLHDLPGAVYGEDLM